MKKKLFLLLMALVVASTNVVLADGAHDALQVTISLTNNVFTLGDSTTLTATTRNISSNDLRIRISFPVGIFYVRITNSFGKTYDVRPRVMIRGLIEFAVLKPGEERTDQVPLTFGKQIEAGDYVLQAIRQDWDKRDKKYVGTASNPLKVQILK